MVKLLNKILVVKIKILFVFLLLNMMNGFAQVGTIYPVDMNVMLTPPYGTCLTDLAGSDRFVIHVLLRDMTHANYDMVIQMRVRSQSNLKTVFLSHSNKFHINAGTPTKIIGKTGSVSISDFFIDKNILTGSAKYGCLDEGSYTFSFQAFDGSSYPVQRIPISKEYTFSAFLEGGAAPILISPMNGDSLCDVQTINFTWQQPFVTSGINSYRFQLVEENSDFSSNDAFDVSPLIDKPTYVPMYQLISTAVPLQKNTTYKWRVVMCDANGEQRKSYPNGGASSIFSFVYCGEKQIQEEDNWVQKVPQVKSINENLDTLRLDTVKNNGGSLVSAFWEKDPQNIREKYSGIIIEIKKLSHDTWTPFKLESQEVNDTSLSLTNIAYNEKYEVRGQYFSNEGEEITYAPYSNIDTFMIENPADSIDCGDPLPDLTECEGTDSAPTFKEYDTFNANGSNVTITSITKQTKNGSSTTLTGVGYVAFPILSNFKLKVKFDEVEINCASELTKGKVISVYDESTAAMIDLNNVIGKGSDGNSLSEEDLPTNKIDGTTDLDNFQNGDLLVDDSGKFYIKDKDGNKIEIGEQINLDSSSQYIDNLSLNDDDIYVKFSNIDPTNIAFDDDESGLFRNVATLSKHYVSFSKKAGSYIIPWTATNPGRTYQIKATPSEKLKGKQIDFIIPSENGYVKLKSEKQNDGTYLVSIPGTKESNKIDLYAISKVNGEDKNYENVGKLNIACYSYKTQKVMFVPLTTVSFYGKEVEEYLNSVYGKLGYSFEVEYDKDTSHTTGIYGKIIDLESSILSEYSSDMKEVINTYLTNVEEIDEESVYIFLMQSPTGKYASTLGDMPQKSPFGFVFLSGNLSDSKPLTTDNYRTIAHELGHGLWGLDHTFCKAYAVPQGTTTNLMDYTTKSPTNYLSYFEWSQIDSPVQSWSVFNSDEGNMASIIVKCNKNSSFSGFHAVLNYLISKKESIISVYNFYKNGNIESLSKETICAILGLTENDGVYFQDNLEPLCLLKALLYQDFVKFMSKNESNSEYCYLSELYNSSKAAFQPFLEDLLKNSIITAEEYKTAKLASDKNTLQNLIKEITNSLANTSSNFQNRRKLLCELLVNLDPKSFNGLMKSKGVPNNDILHDLIKSKYKGTLSSWEYTKNGVKYKLDTYLKKISKDDIIKRISPEFMARLATKNKYQSLANMSSSLGNYSNYFFCLWDIVTVETSDNKITTAVDMLLPELANVSGLVKKIPVLGYLDLIIPVCQMMIEYKWQRDKEDELDYGNTYEMLMKYYKDDIENGNGFCGYYSKEKSFNCSESPTSLIFIKTKPYNKYYNYNLIKEIFGKDKLYYHFNKCTYNNSNTKQTKSNGNSNYVNSYVKYSVNF